MDPSDLAAILSANKRVKVDLSNDDIATVENLVESLARSETEEEFESLATQIEDKCDENGAYVNKSFEKCVKLLMPKPSLPQHAKLFVWITKLIGQFEISSISDDLMALMADRALFDSLPSQSKIAVMATISVSGQPDRFDVMPLLCDVFQKFKPTEPKLAASALFALIRACHQTMLNDSKIDKVKQIALFHANDDDIMIRAAAALWLAIHSIPTKPAIQTLVDLVVDPSKMTQTWVSSTLRNDFVLCGWDSVTDFAPLQDDDVSWDRIASAYLENVPDNLKQSLVIEPLVAHLSNRSRLSSIVDCLVGVTIPDPLPDDIYFDELDKAQQRVLSALNQVLDETDEECWDRLTEANILSKDRLNQLVKTENPHPELKRYPRFDDLWSIDWASLSGAYGTSLEVPKAIKSLASKDPIQRQQAYGIFASHVTHQGSLYDVTLPAINAIAQLLDYTATPAKSEIIARLIIMSIRDPSLFMSQRRFNPTQLAHDGQDFDTGKKCYEAVQEQVPRFLRILQDRTSGPKARVAAAYALAWFPQSSHQIEAIHALQEVLEDSASSFHLRLSCIASLGFLLSDQAELETLAKHRAASLAFLSALNDTSTAKDHYEAVYHLFTLGRLIGRDEKLPEVAAFAALKLLDKNGEFPLASEDDLYREQEEAKGTAYLHMIGQLEGPGYVDGEGLTASCFTFPWPGPAVLLDSIVAMRQADLIEPLLHRLATTADPNIAAVTATTLLLSLFPHRGFGSPTLGMHPKDLNKSRATEQQYAFLETLVKNETFWAAPENRLRVFGVRMYPNIGLSSEYLRKFLQEAWSK